MTGYYVAINSYLSVALLGLLSSCILPWFVRGQRMQWLVQFVLLGSLLSGVYATGSYLLFGDGEPIRGIMRLGALESSFAMVPLASIFLFLVFFVSIPATIFGFRYLWDEREHYRVWYVQSLTAIFILGLVLVTLSRTPIAFFFSWELMSIASFLLVFAGFRKESLHAALFYFIITHLGAGAILAAFLLLSGGSLTIDFSAIAVNAESVPRNYALWALVLFFFGFGSKAGLFPFHGWLPEAHPEAPSHISALLSGVMLAIALFGMISVLPFFSEFPLWFAVLVLSLGLLSGLFGAFYAIIDLDIKRILAWSSIENLGLAFSLIGVSLLAYHDGGESLMNAFLALSVFIVVMHALYKSGLFLSSGVLMSIFGERNIERMGGVARRMPVFSFFVLLLVLSAAALPPFGPFIAEITAIQEMLFQAISVSLFTKISILVTIGTFGIVAGATVFAMVKYFGIAFLARSRSHSEKLAGEPNWEYRGPIAFLAFCVLAFGAFAQPVLDAITRAINQSSDVSLNVPLDTHILALLLIFVAFAAIGIRKFFAHGEKQREYATWDCGQPIDETMEYTGTAFSAPVRFLFKPILKAQRTLSIRPFSDENRWFVEKRVHIDIEPLSDTYLYKPIASFTDRASSIIRRIQSGNIHFYIMLIILALIISAIIAL